MVAPYNQLPLKVFRELVEKPYSNVEAFIDFKSDSETNGVRTERSYSIKWGWTQSKVHRWKPKFLQYIADFNASKYEQDTSENNFQHKPVNESRKSPKIGGETGVGESKSNLQENTLFESILSESRNESRKTPKIGGEMGVSESANESHEYKDQEIATKSPLSLSSKKEEFFPYLLSPLKDGKAKPTLLGKRENKKDYKRNKQNKMPDGYTFESPKDFIGVACNHDGTAFDCVIRDHVTNIQGKLVRQIKFNNGERHEYYLNKKDALAIYQAYNSMNSNPMQQIIQNKALDEVVSNIEESFTAPVNKRPLITSVIVSPLDRVFKLAQSKQININAGNDTSF